jgi:hypothetical protein
VHAPNCDLADERVGPGFLDWLPKTQRPFRPASPLETQPVKLLVTRTAWLLAILPLAVLAADNNSTNVPSDLPEPIATAIAARDCAQLIALNKRYHAEPATAGHAAAIAALEDAILALPACGIIDAALVRVEPIRGVNFFDPQSPLGSPSPGR